MDPRVYGVLRLQKIPYNKEFFKSFIGVWQSQGREKWGEPSVISGWWEGEGSQSVSVPMRWLTLSDATNTRPASQSASETRPRHDLTSGRASALTGHNYQVPKCQYKLHSGSQIC